MKSARKSFRKSRGWHGDHKRHSIAAKKGWKTRRRPNKTINRNNRPLKILVAHDNKTPGHTTKAHNFARQISKDSRFEAICDTHYWKKGEKTSQSEIDKREKTMVQKADLVVRIVPAPSKTGKKRNEGALREVRKAIKAKKPIIEIYEQEGKTSPKRTIQEKNYSKRIKKRLQNKQKLTTAFENALKELSEKEIRFKRYIKNDD